MYCWAESILAALALVATWFQKLAQVWIGSPKRFALVCVLLALSGCGEKPQSAALTLGQATDLALKLANDEAEAQYKCRPFTNGPPAQMLEKRWSWQARQAQGLGDIEAIVKFETNGANPNVRVLFLDSRSVPAFRLR